MRVGAAIASVDDPVQRALARWAFGMRRAVPQLRPTPPDEIAVTVAALGGFPRPDARERLGWAMFGEDACLRTTAVGSARFGGEILLVAGVEDVAGLLAGLHDAYVEILSREVSRRARKSTFGPGIVLGRLRGDEPTRPVPEVPAVSWSPDVLEWFRGEP